MKLNFIFITLIAIKIINSNKNKEHPNLQGILIVNDFYGHLYKARVIINFTDKFFYFKICEVINDFENLRNIFEHYYTNNFDDFRTIRFDQIEEAQEQDYKLHIFNHYKQQEYDEKNMDVELIDKTVYHDIIMTFKPFYLPHDEKPVASGVVLVLRFDKELHLPKLETETEIIQDFYDKQRREKFQNLIDIIYSIQDKKQQTKEQHIGEVKKDEQLLKEKIKSDKCIHLKKKALKDDL